MNYRQVLGRSMVNTSGWLLLIVGLAAVGAGIALEAQGCRYLEADGSESSGIPVMLAGLAFTIIARFLTRRRPDNRIGWIMAGLGIGLPLMNFFGISIDCGLNGGIYLPGMALIAWLNPIVGLLVISLMFVLLPAWFPDGRFMTARWARWIMSALAVSLILGLINAFVPGNINSGLTGDTAIENPIGIPWPLLFEIQPALITGLPITISIATLLSIASFISRFRKSKGVVRQQFKWFATFLSTVVVVHIIGFEIIGALLYPAIFDHWSYDIIIALSFGGFPVVIGLAIFRYRLYDIDLIIRRTLQYSLLTGLLILIFFGGVVVLQGIVRTLSGQSDSPMVTVMTTLGIAALFNPLRIRVQEFIDRRFYRDKYDSEQTLSRLATSVRDEVDMGKLAYTLIRVVEETVKPDQVSLWMKRNPSQEKQ